MAQGAANTLQSIPYQKYMQEMRALGQQPVPPEEFLRMQQPKQGLL